MPTGYILRFFVIAGIITLASSVIFAQSPKEILEQANKEYTAGNYTQAMQSYQKLLAEGWESANLYYNIGNTYYQQQKTAESILFYERALRLQPNNPNIQNNLRLAQKRIAQPTDTLPMLFYQRWWQTLLGLLPTGAWAAGAILLLWLAAASGIGFMLTNSVKRKKITFAMALSCLVLALAFHVLALNRHAFTTSTQYAIVMQENTAIRKGPSDNSDEVNTLSAGVKVRTNEQTNGWVRITLPDNHEGWVNLSALTTI